MKNLKNVGRVAAVVCLLALAAGCSDNKTTNQTAVPQPLNFVAIDSLIGRVAPPEYTGPTGSPMALDSAWLYGNHPLLANVFGNNDPQTLYANISKFKMNMDICEHFLRADANGAVVTGAVSDSVHIETTPGDSIWFNVSGTVSKLNAAVTIPEAAQSIIGTTVDLDYLITLQIAEIPTASFHLGLKMTDANQTFLWFFKDDGAKGETQMDYVSLHLADSTFDFRGIGHCVQAPVNQSPDSSRFSWGYTISSSANADFAYRMAYTSNGWQGINQMFKYLGGGNKNTEFALRYRSYMPADTTACDSLHMYDAVFGPNYTEGTGLISAYNSYLDESLFYPYTAIPQLPLANPFQ
jgi:hypothetical protein